MENLLLVRPTQDMEPLARDYQREHLAHGETELHGSALMDALPYPEWVQRTLDNATPATVYSGWVVADTFLCCGRVTDRSSA